MNIVAPSKALGFTLLEILVAVAIFVIVGTMAMAGYNELITQSDRVDQTASRTRAIQFAVMRMGQDFATLEPRAVRQPLGDELDPALRAGTGTGTDGLIELTHSGWSNPAGVPRPTLQRVAYRLDQGRLQRAYWPRLDRTMNVDPSRSCCSIVSRASRCDSWATITIGKNNGRRSATRGATAVSCGRWRSKSRSNSKTGERSRALSRCQDEPEAGYDSQSTARARRRAHYRGADRRARDDSCDKCRLPGYLDQRRSMTLFSLDQGFEVAMGAEAWAADILRQDKQGGSNVDDFTEEWATPIPPIPVEGGEVSGQLEDMQGRFNLNSLVKLQDGVLVRDDAAVEALQESAGDPRAGGKMGRHDRRLARHRHRSGIS